MASPLWTITLGYFDARDLSNDDDLLGHMLIDVLGTKKPLGMHYMRRHARFPPHEYKKVLDIVRIEASRHLPPSEFDTHQGVDSLLALPSVSKYLKTKSQAQINAFATHALRYLRLYRHNCPVEITQTYRYASRAGKGELRVLASQSISVGHFIDHLQGSLAPLSLEQENMLESDPAARRDFSIIHMNRKSFVLLGPARFVNHDCTPNCTLERVGKTIKVKTLRHISIGEEITVFYSSAYFGDDNCECLCLSCERAGARGFALMNSPEETRSVSPNPAEATSVRLEENSPEVVPTLPFSSMTLNVFPTLHDTGGLKRRSSRLGNRLAMSPSSVLPPPLKLASKVGGTSAPDIPEYCDSTRPCMTCCTQSVSIPDARLCARCSRHFVIFGVSWPRRITEAHARQLSGIRPSKGAMQAHAPIPQATRTPSGLMPTCPPRNLKRKGSRMAVQVSFDTVSSQSIGTLARMPPRKRRRFSK